MHTYLVWSHNLAAKGGCVAESSSPVAGEERTAVPYPFANKSPSFSRRQLGIDVVGELSRSCLLLLTNQKAGQYTTSGQLYAVPKALHITLQAHANPASVYSVADSQGQSQHLLTKGPK